MKTAPVNNLETPLPIDVDVCHALLRHKEALLLEQAATIRLQEREKAQLLSRVEYLVRQLYGRRSEKIDPAQLLLFVAQAMEAVQNEGPQTEAAAVEPEPAPKKKGHGRKKPPAELPRVPIEHPVPDSEKFCDECQVDKVRIGEKITEQIEFAPSSVYILEHIQPVMACPCCESGVTVAPKPAQPIEKALPGPGMLAQVVVSKYADHLPLYRQEAIFERYGIELSRKTMCDWVLGSAHILEPIVEVMKARILESKVIHTDDTPVTVREPGKSGTHEGRFWVYLGDGDHPYTVYDYTPSRRRDGPVAFLEGFVGTKEHPRYLQADAYGGYDGIYIDGLESREDAARGDAARGDAARGDAARGDAARGDAARGDAVLLEVACWAHCRRYFYNARTSDALRSHLMLAHIRTLYDIERETKEWSAADRHTLRQERAKPILKDIKDWLDAEQPRALPQSPIGKAIQYALNQWQALERYLQDGHLDIDNNAAERKIRAIAIGRKNWLFAGSDRGGRAAAILYSMIQTAKEHAVEPFAYLRDLFLRIPTHPNKNIHQLLPDHWKRDILPTLVTPHRP